jgi:trehalose 6-phosphate phosphatase
MEHVADGTSFVDELPSALGAGPDDVLKGRRPVVFLDYDGTLTPIVEHPDDAVLSEPMRRALRALAETHPVAIVSGRDRRDVAAKVALDEIYYAGSHGFDIAGPNGFHEERGAEFRSMLEVAAVELDEQLAAMSGAWVERKRYAVAVHYRQAAPDAEEAIRLIVEDLARRHPSLRASGGKKIFEVRPNLEWDKGRAVLWLQEALGLTGDEFVPVYVGDDETDEDAFRVLEGGEGLGVVVDGSHRPTKASLALAGPDEVATFLDRLADVGSG